MLTLASTTPYVVTDLAQDDANFKHQPRHSTGLTS